MGGLKMFVVMFVLFVFAILNGGRNILEVVSANASEDEGTN